MRAHTPSIATIGALGRPKSPRLAAQIDGDDASAAILEGITRIGITVTDLVKSVTGTVVMADPRLLTELVAEGIGLIDLALRVETGGGGEGWRHESHHEAGGKSQLKGLTHGDT
ncbi:hypothetical protein ASG63_02160 [Methylobacterium sp. Leaf94]|nr:hypothetical protein ASG63_02160 [Methylobacterium sp. Leaf94]